MPIIASVDIGNNTTEIALAKVFPGGKFEFISSSLSRTTGIKGTVKNIDGIMRALNKAIDKSKVLINHVDLILLNSATPVIGGVAMETISETVITESTMIGHNPSTPGGIGLGYGTTILFENLKDASEEKDWIVVIDDSYDFQIAAETINNAVDNNLSINGLIINNDDGVLVSNRLDKKIPIVDEVLHIDKVPIGMKCIVEVAPIGRGIDKLSNPYDIATIFNLNPEETRNIVPIAGALAGLRSAVVIKTPRGNIKERKIPAGSIILIGKNRNTEVDISCGAKDVMDAVLSVSPLKEIKAELGTNVGGMFERIKKTMSDLTSSSSGSVKIQDILAVDTIVSQEIKGGLAGEYSFSGAVGLAAMVESDELPMQQLADKLKERLSITAIVSGVEAEMALVGALTTPGTDKPLAVIDIGGGSTDASLISKKEIIEFTHLAGAGDLVTLLLNKELKLNDINLAERIKIYPLAKVESLFHIRHESGSVQFFKKSMDSSVFGRVVIVTPNGLIPIETDFLIDRIVSIRKKIKSNVFVTNTLRALRKIAPANNIRLIDFVVLVGGSALDFEIPQMITDALAGYRIVTGRANIRGSQGPRNAVATGLIISHLSR